MAEYPHKIVPLEEKLQKEVHKYFPSDDLKFIQCGEKKLVLVEQFQNDMDFYYNLKLTPDDILTLTFSRSGTTLIQEMVWLLANDLNYEEAARRTLVQRFPYLEYTTTRRIQVNLVGQDETPYRSDLNTQEEEEKEEGLLFGKSLEEFKGRRFIKTHLAPNQLSPNLLETGCKVIYVARNPKDVAISFYHFHNTFLKAYINNFPQFWDHFERNLILYSPYWEHIKEGWNLKKQGKDNFLFLFYEDMNKDLRGAVEKVAKFLGKTYSDAEYEKLVDHLKIENFRKNSAVNSDYFKDNEETIGEHGYVRKGVVGKWEGYFDENLTERANKWIRDNMQDADLQDFKFPHVKLF